MSMKAWIIKVEGGRFTTIFYKSGCERSYIESAEGCKVWPACDLCGRRELDPEEERDFEDMLNMEHSHPGAEFLPAGWVDEAYLTNSVCACQPDCDECGAPQAYCSCDPEPDWLDERDIQPDTPSLDVAGFMFQAGF